MKYIIPAKSFIWNDTIPEFMKYKKNVIVIDYNTHDQIPEDYPFTWFKVPVPNIRGLGNLSLDTTLYYKALMTKIDDLIALIGTDDVLVISDTEPRSLVVYKALQNVKSRTSATFRLHLWTIPPFNFMGKPLKKQHFRLCQDLDHTRSILIFNSDDFLKTVSKGTEIKELVSIIQDKLLVLLRHMKSTFSSMQYIESEKTLVYDFDIEGYQDILLSENPVYLKKPFALNHYGIMGDISDDISQASQLPYVPRTNGKEICNYLRNLRLQLAQNNNIPFTSEPCTFNGPCAGTCPKCDEEVRYLSKELEKIPEQNRIYPHAEIPRSMETEERIIFKNYEQYDFGTLGFVFPQSLKSLYLENPKEESDE